MVTVPRQLYWPCQTLHVSCGTVNFALSWDMAAKVIVKLLKGGESVTCVINYVEYIWCLDSNTFILKFCITNCVKYNKLHSWNPWILDLVVISNCTTETHILMKELFLVFYIYSESLYFRCALL